MCSRIDTCGVECNKGLTMAAALVLFLVPKQSALGQFTLGGEYELYSGVGINERPDPYSLRTRLQLRARYSKPGVMIYAAGRVSTNLWDPQKGGEPSLPRGRLLESFLDLYFADVDVRIGHQLVVWGQMDGTFITDVVSPLDLTEFLAQDFTDIRLAVPAVQASYFVNEWSLTGLLTVMPVRSPIPSVSSPWFAVPDELESIQVALDDDNLASAGLDEVEPGLKLTYSGTRTTASIVYFYGRNRIPAFAKTVSFGPGGDFSVALKPDYFRRHVLGTRMSSTTVDPVVLEVEAAYESIHKVDLDPELLLEDPRQGLDAEGLLIREGQLLAGLSVARTFGQTFVKTQVLGSLLTRHDRRATRDEFEEAITMLVHTRWKSDTYGARIFAYYNPGGDYWLNPVLEYNAGPGLNLALGVHLFGGEAANLALSASAFGLFDDNDFAYFRLTLAF